MKTNIRIFILLIVLTILAHGEVKINGLDKLYFKREVGFNPSEKVNGLKSIPMYLNEPKLFKWDNGDHEFSYWIKDFLLFSSSDSKKIWLREVLTNTDMKNEKVWWTIYKGEKVCDSWSFDPYYSKSSNSSNRKALSNYRINNVNIDDTNTVTFQIKCWMYRNGYGWDGYKDFVFSKKDMLLEYLYVINTLTVHYDDKISMSTEELDDSVFLSKKINNVLDETLSQCEVSDKYEMSLNKYLDIVDCIFEKQKSETYTRKIAEACFVERNEKATSSDEPYDSTDVGDLIDGLTK